MIRFVVFNSHLLLFDDLQMESTLQSATALGNHITQAVLREPETYLLVQKIALRLLKDARTQVVNECATAILF